MAVQKTVSKEEIVFSVALPSTMEGNRTIVTVKFPTKYPDVRGEQEQDRVFVMSVLKVASDSGYHIIERFDRVCTFGRRGMENMRSGEGIECNAKAESVCGKGRHRAQRPATLITTETRQASTVERNLRLNRIRGEIVNRLLVRQQPTRIAMAQVGKKKAHELRKCLFCSRTCSLQLFSNCFQDRHTAYLAIARVARRSYISARRTAAVPVAAICGVPSTVRSGTIVASIAERSGWGTRGRQGLHR